jgi:hypothetical protein
MGLSGLAAGSLARPEGLASLQSAA